MALISSSPGWVRRLLWPAAFLLAASAGLTSLSGIVAGAGSGARPATVAAALSLAAVVVLLAVLVVLSRMHREALASADAHAGEVQRLSEQFQRRDARWRNHLDARREALHAAVEHLVRVQLPAALNGSTVPPSPAGTSADDESAALCDWVLAGVGEGAARLREQASQQREEHEESLRLVVVALSRRVQTSAHRIQEEATRMAERYPADPGVLGVSMRVDHAAAQQARHAQSLAVLCGQWPGQQWPEPLALVDVARAASGRIVPYERVEVSGDPEVAASARVAEPLIHLVAELLANATQSSPPRTGVPVAVRTVQRGAVIEIDDGGVGVDENRLGQAREIASGRRPVGLGELGEIPQTGLAVIGQYARRFGFRVDLAESVYGGLRAVVLVPTAVVETVEAAGAAPARPPGPPDDEPEPAPTAGPSAPASPVSVDGAGAGLPRRRSRRGVTTWDPAVAGAGSKPPAAAPPAVTPQEAGAWMGAYLGDGGTGTGAPPAIPDGDPGSSPDSDPGNDSSSG